MRAIADAAQRWADADFPPRVRTTEAIAARTGYSIPVVEYALDRLFFPITSEALIATIESEIGPIGRLDGFEAQGTADSPHAIYARGLDRVCIISSRTTIGVALIPAIFALCAKSNVLVKDREDGLIAAFFATLSEELDEFAESAVAQNWDSTQADAQDLGAYDAVVVFGTDRTLGKVRANCSPAARFIGYGSRASTGYIAAADLQDKTVARKLAAGAARDLILYDSEGCLSLHLLFVERGAAIAPLEFAELLSAEAGIASIEFPIGTREPAAAAALGNYRNLAAFRAATGNGAVFGDETCSHIIAFDPPRNEPPAFLPRVIGVIPVDGPADALRYLRTHAIALEGFALSAQRPELTEMAVRSGAVRFTQFGQLQNPPLASRHGGLPRIAEFIQWIEQDP
ncbi:MAG: hypothetical protein M3Y21_12095 [Candidatus Eremiobacteraeota bacterium]|nr:hypothetical protein [Candidatus Eremiobacteraeota bacterium]